MSPIEKSSKLENVCYDIRGPVLKEAKLKFYDVLLVDTAGRLHVDEAMMDEIKQVHAGIGSDGVRRCQGRGR